MIVCRDGTVSTPTILLAILSPFLSKKLAQPPEASYGDELPFYLTTTLNLPNFSVMEVNALLHLGRCGSCMVSKVTWMKLVQLMRVLKVISMKIVWKPKEQSEPKTGIKRSQDFGYDGEVPVKKKNSVPCKYNCGKTFTCRKNMIKHSSFCTLEPEKEPTTKVENHNEVNNNISEAEQKNDMNTIGARHEDNVIQIHEGEQKLEEVIQLQLEQELMERDEEVVRLRVAEEREQERLSQGMVDQELRGQLQESEYKLQQLQEELEKERMEGRKEGEERSALVELLDSSIKQIQEKEQQLEEMMQRLEQEVMERSAEVAQLENRLRVADEREQEMQSLGKQLEESKDQFAESRKNLMEAERGLLQLAIELKTEKSEGKMEIQSRSAIVHLLETDVQQFKEKGQQLKEVILKLEQDFKERGEEIAQLEHRLQAAGEREEERLDLGTQEVPDVTADEAWRSVQNKFESTESEGGDPLENDCEEDVGDVCEAELKCGDCQRGGDHFHCEAPVPTILQGDWKKILFWICIKSIRLK